VPPLPDQRGRRRGAAVDAGPAPEAGLPLVEPAGRPPVLLRGAECDGAAAPAGARLSLRGGRAAGALRESGREL
jgi:hypothetical protein